VLDTLGSAQAAATELGILQKAVALGGVTVARRVQGSLNGAMAQHMILHMGLEQDVVRSESSPWYGGSSEHVSAGVEDSF
jgi:hypothetical protein